MSLREWFNGSSNDCWRDQINPGLLEVYRYIGTNLLYCLAVFS